MNFLFVYPSVVKGFPDGDFTSEFVSRARIKAKLDRNIEDFPVIVESDEFLIGEIHSIDDIELGKLDEKYKELCVRKKVPAQFFYPEDVDVYCYFYKK